MEKNYYVCFFCGELLELNEDKLAVFGVPFCCKSQMCKIENENLHELLGALEKIKKSIENEIVKDF